MAKRYIRDTVIAAKIEATEGTDSIPTGAANAMAVSNVRIQPLDAQYVSRDLIRAWFGASEDLINTFNKSVSFDVEAVGSGTAGTVPAWSPLIRACGFSEAITVTEQVRYKPVTNGQESSSMYVWDSGVLHKLLGARGMVQFGMGLGNIPKMRYTFLGVDGGDTAAVPGSVSYSVFQPPQVVTNQFTGSLTLGGALSATGAPPTITGGTVYPSRGLDVDMGIRATYMPLLDQETIEITDRKASAKVTLDATAAQEVAFYQAIKDGTLQGLSLVHGTVAGRRFGIFAPAAQQKSPSKDEMEGKRLLTYDFLLLPTVSGNDEVTIFTSF